MIKLSKEDLQISTHTPQEPRDALLEQKTTPSMPKPSKPRSKRSGDKTITRLTNRHMAMMRHLVIDGMKLHEIASEYNISRDRLSTLRNTPLWKEREETMRLELLSLEKIRMGSLAEHAVDALKEGLQEHDPRVRLSSAKEVLDRIGMGAGDHEETSNHQTQINLYIPDCFNKGHLEKE